jgi:hypothetical protein
MRRLSIRSIPDAGPSTPPGLTLAHGLLLAEALMPARLPTAAFVVALLVAPPLSRADDTPPAAPPEPYDSPAAAPAPPAAAPVKPVEPSRAAQVSDDEAPRRAPPKALVAPPVALREPIPTNPSEPALIVGESILGALTSFGGLVVGGTAFVVAGPGGFLVLLAAPAATGGVVCAIGSGSSYFDGQCGAAIGGAYLGSLLAVPTASLFARTSNASDAIGAVLAGALLGYIVGSTVGAVVGWNLSRKRKDASHVDVARLDALSAARLSPWREPLLPRGAALDVGGPRLESPVLAFRF